MPLRTASSSGRSTANTRVKCRFDLDRPAIVEKSVRRQAARLSMARRATSLRCSMTVSLIERCKTTSPELVARRTYESRTLASEGPEGPGREHQSLRNLPGPPTTIIGSTEAQSRWKLRRDAGMEATKPTYGGHLGRSSVAVAGGYMPAARSVNRE